MQGYIHLGHGSTCSYAGDYGRHEKERHALHRIEEYDGQYVTFRYHDKERWRRKKGEGNGKRAHSKINPTYT